MRRVAAYYLLASCIFLLGYAAYLLATQWSDAEGTDLLLLLVFWILPCVAGIYLVIANRLHSRTPARSSAD